ncbi:MAG: hypothetical protein RAK22_01120 [Nanoarchaeota archaeon]|nr:hypothetical protein [Nanoarchaeota archaeon]
MANVKAGNVNPGKAMANVANPARKATLDELLNNYDYVIKTIGAVYANFSNKSRYGPSDVNVLINALDSVSQEPEVKVYRPLISPIVKALSVKAQNGDITDKDIQYGLSTLDYLAKPYADLIRGSLKTMDDSTARRIAAAVSTNSKYFPSLSQHPALNSVRDYALILNDYKENLEKNPEYVLSHWYNRKSMEFIKAYEKQNHTPEEANKVVNDLKAYYTGILSGMSSKDKKVLAADVYKMHEEEFNRSLDSVKAGAFGDLSGVPDREVLSLAALLGQHRSAFLSGLINKKN